MTQNHSQAKQGLFITVEGIEGAGKSSNIAFIESHLKNAGKDVLLTREPGGTELAEDIRQLLLQPREESMSAMAELLLVFAARAQHVEKVIKPALVAGKIVLCDRFTDATLAYQGGGRGLSLEKIQQLSRWVQLGLQPDITLLLDVPVEVGLARARGRNPLDRIEQEQSAFFQRVREKYLTLATAEPERFIVLDASQELTQIHQQLEQVLHARLAVK